MRRLVLSLLLFFPLFSCAETIESDNFLLRDAKGRITAQLTASGEGTPAFFIYDEKGTVRVSIGLYGDGAPGVVLNDDKGRAGAIVRLTKNTGDPVVVLKENGEDRYVIRESGPDGAPGTGMLPWLLMTFVASSLASAAIATVVARKRASPPTSDVRL